MSEACVPEYLVLMRRFRTVVVPVLLILSGFNLAALAFPTRPIIPTWPSEIRSTLTRFEVYHVSDAPTLYPWTPIDRPVVEIDLATTVPVVQTTFGGTTIFLGLPFSVTTVDDLIQEDTAPVINTDYWFGVTIQAISATQWSWPRNIGVNLRPVFHESSHIGDEFALHMLQSSPDEYYRINVSYEAWEAVIGLNEWHSGTGNTVTVRGGITGLWNSDGYYSNWVDAEVAPAAGTVYRSERRLEYSLQVHTVIEDSPIVPAGWRAYAGGEARWRAQLDYFSPGTEELVPGLDLCVGLFRDRERGPVPGFYLEHYAGQMPWGMFREQTGHRHTGLGFSLAM